MKAMLVNDDRSLRWDNVPDPILGDEDCMVKIKAAALNRADLMQREGDYPSGSPMENANLICFLASDEASYISGQNIQIDGCRKKQ